MLVTIMSAWAVLRGAFGALLLVRPAVGLVTLVYLVGGAALVFGIFSIALALHLRTVSTDDRATSRPNV